MMGEGFSSGKSGRRAREEEEEELEGQREVGKSPLGERALRGGVAGWLIGPGRRKRTRMNEQRRRADRRGGGQQLAR